MNTVQLHRALEAARALDEMHEIVKGLKLAGDFVMANYRFDGHEISFKVSTDQLIEAVLTNKDPLLAKLEELGVNYQAPED